MCSCLTVLPAVSDPRKVESNPGKHESCPIRVIFREDARVAIRQGHAALTRVGRVRDCDVWSRSGYGRWNVREIFHDRSDRRDWDFGGTAVATHFRRGRVSNLDTSLGHKAIPHNPNGERARRIARPRGERLDTGLSLDLHRRWPSPLCASLDRHMIRPIDGLLRRL